MTRWNDAELALVETMRNARKEFHAAFDELAKTRSKSAIYSRVYNVGKTPETETKPETEVEE